VAVFNEASEAEECGWFPGVAEKQSPTKLGVIYLRAVKKSYWLRTCHEKVSKHLCATSLTSVYPCAIPSIF
jgi:hypothetical protein